MFKSIFIFRTLTPNIHRMIEYRQTVRYLRKIQFQSTGIPRLTRFFIARFPIARIFEVVQENLHSTVLYLKIYSVMQIFLTFFQVIL